MRKWTTRGIGWYPATDGITATFGLMSVELKTPEGMDAVMNIIKASGNYLHSGWVKKIPYFIR